MSSLYITQRKHFLIKEYLRIKTEHFNVLDGYRLEFLNWRIVKISCHNVFSLCIQGAKWHMFYFIHIHHIFSFISYVILRIKNKKKQGLTRWIENFFDWRYRVSS